jgi:hypothetical protein
MPINTFKTFVQNNTGLIYCDMDGVLVDFDLGVKKTLPHIFEETSPYNYRLGIEDWKIIESDPHWWLNLKPTKDCMTLWNYIKGPRTFILSAVPNPSSGLKDFDNIRKQKEEWCKKYLGINTGQIIITRREMKKVYAKSSGVSNVLIDDTPLNIKEWNNSGGKGILFKNASDTIRQLKKWDY